MQFRKGWAAFIALVVLLLLSSSIALAGDGRPVIGCFNPGNAALLGRFGPSDPAVRAAFDLGGCLSLSADVPVSSPLRAGAVWQVQVLGSPVPVFAPPWGAPIADRGPDLLLLQEFASFAGQSAMLLREGRLYVYCETAEEDLERRWRDFRKRWDRYRSEGGRDPGNTGIVVVRNYADDMPKLVHEADALQGERSMLERKCSAVHELVLDERFVDFLRTLR